MLTFKTKLIFIIYFIDRVNFTTCSENIMAGLKVFMKCSKSFM
jgi:hypothetical protein